MQSVTLTRTFRGIDDEGKAIFDYLVYGEKDNGDKVDTIIKNEDREIVKGVERFIDSFVSKKDEFEILKKNVEYLSLSKIGQENIEDVPLDFPDLNEVDLPGGIDLPGEIDLAEEIDFPPEETETEEGEGK